MIALSSRQGCFSNVHLRKFSRDNCLAPFLSSSFRRRCKPVRCTAYRGDSEDDSETQRRGPQRSVLASQLSSLQLQRPRSSSRLIRRREVPAKPEVDSEGSLNQSLQRSQPESQNRLPFTEPVKPRTQGLLRARDSFRQSSGSSSRQTSPLRTHQPAQTDAKPAKPFNARQGKMSPEDWKVWPFACSLRYWHRLHMEI